MVKKMNRKGEVFFDNVICGTIEETDEGYLFTYNKEWLNYPLSQPISLTLPLTSETYFSNVLFPFFDGLIPEGWLLEVALSKWNLNRNDRMGLLLTVCEDSIGAVSVKEVR